MGVGGLDYLGILLQACNQSIKSICKRKGARGRGRSEEGSLLCKQGFCAQTAFPRGKAASGFLLDQLGLTEQEQLALGMRELFLLSLVGKMPSPLFRPEKAADHFMEGSASPSV